MFSCIYTRQIFDNAPGEHILQNFLGARWTSSRIVCAEVQAEFGRTIDVTLERGLQPIRNMFGTLGGRGESGPILRKLEASSGEAIDLEPGFRPRLREPVVQVTPRADGRHDVRIQLGSLQQLGWALHLLQQQLPDACIDESMLRAATQSVQNYVRGTVQLELSIGGSEYFRGALKACFNRLGVAFPDVALNPCFDPVRRFILDGNGDMTEFVAWVQSSDRLMLPRLGPIDHFVGIVTRGTSVECVVQFFGDVVHSFRLTDSYSGPEIQSGYLVDPTRQASPAEDRSPMFDESAIPMFSEQSPQDNESVQAALKERINRIVAQFYEQAEARLVNETLNDVLRPHMGQPFTQELAGRLAQALADRVLRMPRNRNRA